MKEEHKQSSQSPQDKHSDLEHSLERMLRTTSTFDNFQQMMKTTRTFDEELQHQTEKTTKSIYSTLNRVFRMTYILEKRSESTIRTRLRVQKLRKVNENSLIGKVISRIPAKYRNLPLAFRRNPQLVVKYFLGMIFGRILAILLYILAAFIPAIPVPDSVQGVVGRPIRALGSMVVSARGVVSDPTVIIAMVTNIPTDVNKLLQKVGEFFQFYGRRVWAFTIRAVRHPRLAYEDVKGWSRANARFFTRVCRTAVTVTCSFLMIKLAMVFLLPLLGGIAITVAGLKVSILLVVVVRMIVDKIGELIGIKVYGKVKKHLTK